MQYYHVTRKYMHSFRLLKIFHQHPLKRNVLQFSKLLNIKYQNPNLNFHISL